MSLRVARRLSVVAVASFAFHACRTPVLEPPAPAEEEASPGPTITAAVPPAPSAARCQELRSQILTLITHPLGSVDRDGQDDLVRLVRSAEGLPGASEQETCVVTISREMARAPTCGSAAELAVSTMAVDGVVASSVIEEALARSGACVTFMIAGLASAPSADPRVAAALESWTLRQADPMRRSGGFVVLASLGRKARDAGDLVTAHRVDASLIREMRSAASDVQRVQMIEAAGNAGCSSCAEYLSRGLADRAPEVRRASVGAFRFIPAEAAAVVMCNSLSTEADVNVRDTAAWALRWRNEGARSRVECLVRAATRDDSGRVRISAARSLATLAKVVPHARSALLELTDPRYGDEQVRAIAVQTATAFPPEEAPDRPGSELVLESTQR